MVALLLSLLVLFRCTVSHAEDSWDEIDTDALLQESSGQEQPSQIPEVKEKIDSFLLAKVPSESEEGAIDTLASHMTPDEINQARQAVVEVMNYLPGGDPFFEYCAPGPEHGPCTADFHYFYFDITSGVCRPFVWGGCHGNLNRFEDEWTCMETCVYSPSRRAGITRERRAMEALEAEKADAEENHDDIWKDILPGI